MTQHLVLTIRLHDPRYHGTADWPPAPARVFQALVAGAARGEALPPRATPALEWLERLPPPVIAAPRMRPGSRVELFVPNNDVDSVGGDPARIGEVRTQKVVQPLLLDEDTPLVYAWPLPAEPGHATSVIELATDLYQLGRGVDMAWAVGELLEDEQLATRLASHRGTVHRPDAGDGGAALACPTPGSLDSLALRHHANLERIRTEGAGKAARTLFSQPPKPRFASIPYESGRHEAIYALRDRDDDARSAPWPLARVVELVEQLRDLAAARLGEALPDQVPVIRRALIGRKPDGRDAAPIAQRVRIVPLPSIGHEHVDPAVRRVLVEVPGNCPLHPADVQWAFSGLSLGRLQLTPTNERDMLGRYDAPGRRWHSITAVALPTEAQRRRVEPSRRRAEAKGASERAGEQGRAADAVRTALRHAGVLSSIADVKVRREPFEPRGARAEAFATARFAKERLWHVELELREPVEGPLLLGDGRFLGLGLMVPSPERRDIFGFAIDAEDAAALDGDALVRAMRRAVMSRVQAVLGPRPLGRFFSGHEEDGEPARSDRSNHLAIQWDPAQRRLLILAPHVLDRRAPGADERRHLTALATALEGFVDLRAGRAGRYRLARASTLETDEYAARSRTWVSVRPYTVTRHAKAASAADALIENAILECASRGLPRPTVTVLAARGIPGRGLEGELQLDFAVAVEGPVVLGRTRYLGGGLFAPSARGPS
ncbi:MAG: type I-G CRISPR-associated protein Csb2 [Kofleriaceae bacterium]